MSTVPGKSVVVTACGVTPSAVVSLKDAGVTVPGGRWPHDSFGKSVRMAAC
jgi:hypothetical protein